MKKEKIKLLYSKNPALAKEVAAALGFKIAAKKITAKKDRVAIRLASLAKTILGFKPKKVRVKQKGNVAIYTCGELVDEGLDQIVIKLTNRDGNWEVIVGIPIIHSDAFLKSDKAADEDKIFDALEKFLKQAKNFLKINNAHLNKDGEIITTAVIAFKVGGTDLRRTLEKLYDELQKKQQDYTEVINTLKATLAENNVPIPPEVVDLCKKHLASLANFDGGLQEYFKEDLLGQFLLQDKLTELEKLTPPGWTFKPGKAVKEDGKFSTGAMFLKKGHENGDPLIYVFGFSADSNDFHIAVAQNQKALKEVKGIPLSLVRNILKEYADSINQMVKESSKKSKDEEQL